MPPCSTRRRASWDSCWRSISFSASCWTRISRACATVTVCFWRRPKSPGHHVLEVDADLLDPLGGEHLEARGAVNPRLRPRPYAVELAVTQTLAELLARVAWKSVVDPLVTLAGGGLVGGGTFGMSRSRRRSSARSSAACSHRRALLFLEHGDADLGQIAHDRLDVATDVADLGELGGFDFEEWRLGQLGQAPGDLGLADAGGADHQDVLRQDLLGQR